MREQLLREDLASRGYSDLEQYNEIQLESILEYGHPNAFYQEKYIADFRKHTPLPSPKSNRNIINFLQELPPEFQAVSHHIMHYDLQKVMDLKLHGNKLKKVLLILVHERSRNNGMRINLSQLLDLYDHPEFNIPKYRKVMIETGILQDSNTVIWRSIESFALDLKLNNKITTSQGISLLKYAQHLQECHEKRLMFLHKDRIIEVLSLLSLQKVTGHKLYSLSKIYDPDNARMVYSRVFNFQKKIL